MIIRSHSAGFLSLWRKEIPCRHVQKIRRSRTVTSVYSKPEHHIISDFLLHFFRKDKSAIADTAPALWSAVACTLPSTIKMPFRAASTLPATTSALVRAVLNQAFIHEPGGITPHLVIEMSIGLAKQRHRSVDGSLPFRILSFCMIQQFTIFSELRRIIVNSCCLLRCRSPEIHCLHALYMLAHCVLGNNHIDDTDSFDTSAIIRQEPRATRVLLKYT